MHMLLPQIVAIIMVEMVEATRKRMTTKKQWKKEEVISTWKGFKKWHEFPGLGERVRVCRMSPANGYKELPIMIYYVRKTEKAILPSLFGRLSFVSLDRVQTTRNYLYQLFSRRIVDASIGSVKHMLFIYLVASIVR